MKKLLLSVGFLLIGIIGNPHIVSAQTAPVLEFFYGAECPHCHEEKKWFPTLKKLYPSLEIREYEVWHNTKNKKIWERRMAELNKKPSGVPTNIFEDEVLVGFDKKKILEILKQKLGPPKDISDVRDPEKQADYWRKYLSFSWPVMSFVLGVVDGFNPCAMWSLLILLSFLLTIDSKKRRWLIGGVFIGSSGILYFGALLTYLFGFTEISSFVAGAIMTWIFRAVGILAIGTGALSLKSSLTAQIDCSVRDGSSKKRFHDKMSEVLAREKFWFVLTGVIGLAFSVNAIELLCSFAIPTAFTATLVSLKISLWSELSAVSIYTFAYILDDLIVFLIAMWTLSLTVFSPKIVRFSHLAGGIFLVILGLVLLINPSILAALGSF